MYFHIFYIYKILLFSNINKFGDNFVPKKENNRSHDCIVFVNDRDKKYQNILSQSQFIIKENNPLSDSTIPKKNIKLYGTSNYWTLESIPSSYGFQEKK